MRELRSGLVGRRKCQTARGRPAPEKPACVRTKYVACDDREDRSPSLGRYGEDSRLQTSVRGSLCAGLPGRSASAWCCGSSPRGSPRRHPPRRGGRGGGRRRPRHAAHDVEPAQASGLLQLLSQAVEQAGGGNRRLSRHPFDQAVHHHMGESFDLRIDDRDRLVGKHSGGATETGHARINSSRRPLRALAHRSRWSWALHGRRLQTAATPSTWSRMDAVVTPEPGGRQGSWPGRRRAPPSAGG